jgi:hypothetical protein
LLTATLLVCLQASGQAPAQQFDVRLRAAVGEVMARRLSDVFGTKVTTDASLADVPMVFNVKGVTFVQFRELSAKGLDAEWRQTSDGWHVYRSKEKQDAELQAQLQRRRALLVKSLASREVVPPTTQQALAELAQKVKLAFGDELDGLAYGSEVLTGEHVLYDVWQSLGVEAIAAMPINQRWTYTSDGFRKTRRLEVLAQTAALVNAEYKRVEAEFRRSGAWDRLANEANGYTPEQLLGYLGVSPVDRFVLEVMSGVEYVELTLTGYDKEGSEAVIYYDYIEAWETQPSASLGPLGTGAFEPSKESLALRRAVTTMFGDGDGGTAGAEVLDLLAGMPETDPLALDVTDILFAASDKAGLQLAGRLNDDLAPDLGLYRLEAFDEDEGVILERPATLRDALSWLDNYLSFSVSDKEMFVGPETPAQFQTFFPRKAVADYVRSNVGSAVLDVARFPSLFQPPQSLDVASLSEVALIAHGNEYIVYMDAPYLIAAWQGLNQQLKMQAESPQGATLTIGRAHRSLGYRFEEQALRGGRWSSFGFGLASDDESMVALDDLLLFDVAPGAFDRLPINLRVQRKPVAMVTMEGLDEPTMLTAEDLAEWYFYSDEDGKGAEWLAKCRFGLESGVEIKLTFQTPVGMGTEETTVVTTSGARADMTLQQMPADFQQAFRREVERLKKDGG